MKLRVGQTLRSPVDDANLIVVKAPEEEVDLACAGVPLFDAKAAGDPPTGSADPQQQAGTQLGKRYVDTSTGVELLCTKAGKGTLTVNGAAVGVAVAKPLPSSD